MRFVPGYFSLQVTQVIPLPLQLAHIATVCKYGTWRLKGATAVARRTSSDTVMGGVMSRLFTCSWPSGVWLHVKNWSALPLMYLRFSSFQHLFSPSIFRPHLPSSLHLSSPTHLHLSPNYSTSFPPSTDNFPLIYFLFYAFSHPSVWDQSVASTTLYTSSLANHCNVHHQSIRWIWRPGE